MGRAHASVNQFSSSCHLTREGAPDCPHCHTSKQPGVPGSRLSICLLTCQALAGCSLPYQSTSRAPRVNSNQQISSLAAHPTNMPPPPTTDRSNTSSKPPGIPQPIADYTVLLRYKRDHSVGCGSPLFPRHDVLDPASFVLHAVKDSVRKHATLPSCPVSSFGTFGTRKPSS